MKIPCEFKDRKLLKAVLIMSGIYILGITAIIRANAYYIDDMGRACYGYKQFDFFSRYVAYFLCSILHADSYLTDISPLPQLLAAVILGLSAVTVLHVVTGRNQFSVMEYIATIPLGLSPYFLECLSYKFDAPYMAISVLASVAPVLFYRHGNFRYCLSVFLGMLVVCMTYQAASGIFPMFVVLVAFLRWLEDTDWKEVLRFVLLSVAGYVAGMLCYALFIMKPTNSYVSNTVASAADLIPSTIAHLKEYYYVVVHDFKVEWLAMIALLGVGFLFVSVRDSKHNKVLSFFVSGMAMVAFLALAFGVYPALSNPLYDPRAMYGFGALICFIAMPIVTRKKAKLFKLVCAMLCWCFFVFGFTYGNALHAQKVYTDYRIAAVIDDLDELDMLDEENPKVYQIDGNIGYAPEIRHMPQDYKMLNRLVPITFGDSSSYWGGYSFSNYYGIKNLIWDYELDLGDLDLPLMKDSIYHSIYGNEEYVRIVIKE